MRYREKNYDEAGLLAHREHPCITFRDLHRNLLMKISSLSIVLRSANCITMTWNDNITGDITINPNATCLIMTTEILRSMLYRCPHRNCMIKNVGIFVVSTNRTCILLSFHTPNKHFKTPSHYSKNMWWDHLSNFFYCFWSFFCDHY